MIGEKAVAIKKIVWTVVILSFTGLLVGCAEKEIIRVGTPFTDEEGGEGVNFHREITDSKSIGALRKIVENAHEVDKPEELVKESALFFALDRPKEGVSEIRRFVYFPDDGSAILYRDGVSGADGFPDQYFIVDEQETNKLKRILQ